jgi:hypothetical protein
MQFYSDSGELYYLDEELSDPGLGAFGLVMAEMLDSAMIEWEKNVDIESVGTCLESTGSALTTGSTSTGLSFDTIVNIASLGTRSESTGLALTTGLASTGSSFDIVLLLLGTCLGMKCSAPLRSVMKNYG